METGERAPCPISKKEKNFTPSGPGQCQPGPDILFNQEKINLGHFLTIFFVVGLVVVRLGVAGLGVVRIVVCLGVVRLVVCLGVVRLVVLSLVVEETVSIFIKIVLGERFMTAFPRNNAIMYNGITAGTTLEGADLRGIQ